MREGLADERITFPAQVIPGHDDYAQVGPALFRLFRKVIPGHSGHVDIGHQELDARIFREAVQCIRGAVGRPHLAPEVLENLDREIEDQRLVVNDKDHRGHLPTAPLEEAAGSPPPFDRGQPARDRNVPFCWTAGRTAPRANSKRWKNARGCTQLCTMAISVKDGSTGHPRKQEGDSR
jgi:hypothetical protein